MNANCHSQVAVDYQIGERGSVANEASGRKFSWQISGVKGRNGVGCCLWLL